MRDVPGISGDIVGVATYWDAKITQAERLCIEMIRDARRANPECAAINYIAPQRAEAGRVVLKDLESGESFVVEPQIVVNATGSWLDFANAAVLGEKTQFMGGTKGLAPCRRLSAAF